MTDIRLRIDPSRDILDQLIDQVIVLANEAQDLFSERYAEYSWRADLGDDKPVFWFERKPEPATFRPHFIGSTSGVSNTWLWGWENINGFPAQIVELAERLRDIASPFDAAELTTAQLPLDPAARNAAGLPERDEYSYVYAAMAVSELEAPVFYRGPSGGGSYTWFVLDNTDEFELPAPSPLATIRAITYALDSGLLHDHRLAVTSYAQRRDGVSLSEGEGSVTLSTPAGDVIIDLDEADRIVRVSGSAGSDGLDTVDFPHRAQAGAEQPAPAPRGLLGRLFGKGR